MKKIEASKLNRSLKEVLSGIAAGERYEITRYGKVVAKLVPPGTRDPKPFIDPDVMTLEQVEALEPVDANIGGKPVEPLTPDQIRQKRRDFLLNRINRPKK